ncbi:hypothetical protein [Parvicella tangerina]|nr:hypothetical protein [Parvicella tangerina]
MAKKKYKKYIKIVLPTQLVEKLNNHLETNPPSFEYQIETFFGIMWDIVQREHEHENGMTPMSSTIMQAKYGGGNQYLKHIDYLKKIGILYVNDFHDKNLHQCKRFTIISPYQISCSKDLVDIKIDTNSYLGKYIINRRAKEIKAAKSVSIPSHIRKLRNHFYEMKYDGDKAIEELESLRHSLSGAQFISHVNDINSIANSDNKLRFFIRNEHHGRVYTNITSLGAFLKKHIISDDRLIQIDLNNSHPVLFNIILNHIENLIDERITLDKYLTLSYVNKCIKDAVCLIYKEIQKNPIWVKNLRYDISQYRFYTARGIWYEHISDIYNNHYSTDLFDRAKAKSIWMAMAYSSNYSKEYNICKIPFEKEFVAIGKILRILKQKEYNQFAILMDRIESNLFIDCICKELCDNDIIPYTIHDCLIVPEKHLDEVRAAINRIMEQHLGFIPSLSEEALNEIHYKPKYEPLDIARLIRELENNKMEVD